MRPLNTESPQAVGDGISGVERAAYAARVAGITPAEMRHRFEGTLRWYAKFLEPWLPGNRGARMLDLPCGAGNLLFALKTLGYDNVQGVDGDEVQVTCARALGLPAQLGDAFATIDAERPGSVERVFSLDFLEHIEKERAIDFCQIVRQRLSPGGIFLARTPSADGPFGAAHRYADITHRWGMTSGAAVQMLGLAGFEAQNCAIVQEAPVAHSWPNRLRRTAFAITTTLAGTALDVLGIGAPRVWTRSMWLVARA
jgi:2-polyprenyl-3-methyl-5-hydroxy-6-metoxy-1,4-benzoquinol methylase